MSQLNVCDITLCANNAPKVPISEQTYKRAALTLGIFMTVSLFIAAFDVYIMYYVYRKKLKVHLHGEGCGVFQTLSLPINPIHLTAI